MRKNAIIFVSLAVLSFGLLGCPPKESGGTATAAGGGGDILVGEYGSMTGGQATFGQSTHNGIMMAADEVNAAGGINGRKVKILSEDDQSKPEEAPNAVQKLISQNNVLAIIGEVASSASIAAAPICQLNKVPMITPSSTNDEVTRKGDYIFRICFTDSYQGEYQAVFADQWCSMNGKPKSMAMLTDVKSDYSQGLKKVVTAKFTALGGKVVGTQGYAQGDSDFHSQLTALKATNPSIIYVPGYYTDIGQIAIQARDLGITVPLLGGDGWESPRLIEIGGKSLEGCIYSNHYFYGDPSPVVSTFVQKYKQRYGQTPDSLAALGYDAMKTLADAMKRAAKLDGPSLRDAIAKTRGLVGVTGTINIGPDRNAMGKSLVIEEIKNGQLTLKATIDPSKGGKVEMNNGTAPAAAPPTTTGGPAASPKAATTTTG
ncbi:MAG TPA: ABC transporter substrate-binding protein [Thermoanaerobaculia bacterium]|jgi:branched-chain amino acid transport system substrate-binding protein|nr:ABC transporter substrate-binding protein [Thermoanaerobaculia bacterium]